MFLFVWGFSCFLFFIFKILLLFKYVFVCLLATKVHRFSVVSLNSFFFSINPVLFINDFTECRVFHRMHSSPFSRKLVYVKTKKKGGKGVPEMKSFRSSGTPVCWCCLCWDRRSSWAWVKKLKLRPLHKVRTLEILTYCEVHLYCEDTTAWKWQVSFFALCSGWGKIAPMGNRNPKLVPHVRTE